LLPAVFSRAVKRLRFPALGHPHTVARVRSPLRATGRSLYPNPIRSNTSRHETVAPPAGDSDDARLVPFSGSRAFDDPTTRAPPPRRVGAHGPGRLHGALGTLRHACAWARCTGTCPDGLRARLDPGPRAASPVLPRRRTGSAAPEVPSIDETGHRRPHERPHQAPIRTTGGRGEPYLYPGMVLSTDCCQPVDNTRRLFQSRCIRRP